MQRHSKFFGKFSSNHSDRLLLRVLRYSNIHNRINFNIFSFYVLMPVVCHLQFHYIICLMTNEELFTSDFDAEVGEGPWMEFMFFFIIYFFILNCIHAGVLLGCEWWRRNCQSPSSRDEKLVGFLTCFNYFIFFCRNAFKINILTANDQIPVNYGSERSVAITTKLQLVQRMVSRMLSAGFSLYFHTLHIS